MDTPPILATDKSFPLERAVHDITLQIQASHQEDFSRLIKVLSKITGFRLYFAEIDQLPYRDQLLHHVDHILTLTGQTSLRLDLSTQSQVLPFAEFEDYLRNTKIGDVVHVLNSELWLAEHVSHLNIRRDAIAHHAKCALVWWLPRSALQTLALSAPDAWSWRHGVFSFAKPQTDGAQTSNANPLDLSASLLDDWSWSRASLPQISKRLAELRQMLAQDMGEDLRYPLLLEMAHLLRQTGHPDDALTVLREQVLPLAQALQAEIPSAHAVTMSNIAEILTDRGEFEEALGILRDEVLPILDKFGQVHAQAVVLGKIANILMLRGELDDALRIRREIELPVYVKLGDTYAQANTIGKVADILIRRNELEEALRLLQDEALPMWTKLGNVRGYATNLGRIAKILAKRGETKQALDFLNEELSTHAKQGDLLSHTVTQSNICEVLLQRGELEEALRLMREVLPAYVKLGALRELVVTRTNLATCLLQRGQAADYAEAQQLLRLAISDAKKLKLPELSWLEDMLKRSVASKPV